MRGLIIVTLRFKPALQKKAPVGKIKSRKLRVFGVQSGN